MTRHRWFAEISASTLSFFYTRQRISDSGAPSTTLLRRAVPLPPLSRGRKDKRFRSRGKREQMRNNERHERLASLKQEGRRSAERRTIGPHRQAMRRAPFLLSSLRRTEVAGDLKKWSGRARLSAPHRGIRGFLGLGSAQAALPGITGCKREDPLRHQCSEHLAVRHAPDGTMPKPPVSAVYGRAHENRSRSAPRSTLAKAIICQLTKTLRHGNILPRSRLKGSRHGKTS